MKPDPRRELPKLRASASISSIAAHGALLLCLLLSACFGENEDPEAATVRLQSDTATVPWNAASPIDVLSNDSASSGALTLTVVSAPSHGTATIIGGRVVYTPTTGYIGSDAFSYTVAATDGGATATAAVALTVNAQLLLSGTVSDSPLAAASIVATVGARTYQAVTSSSGVYSLLIASAQPTEMVVLSAQGSGAQTAVKLVSLVGDVATIAGLASAGGTVGANGLPSLNVSNLTSAVAAFVLESNSGLYPTSQAQLASMVMTVSPNRVAELATAIKLIADFGVGLPSGVADTWVLASNPSSSSTLSNFLISLSGSANFSAARSAVLASSALSGAPLAPGASPTTLAYFVGNRFDGEGGVLIAYRNDGSATVANRLGKVDGTWTVSGGRLAVRFPPTLQETVYGFNDPATGAPIRVRSATTGYDILQVSGSQGSGMALLVPQGSSTVIEGPQIGEVIPFSTSQGLLRKVLDVATATPLASADFAVNSRWAGVLADASIDFDVAAAQGDILRVTGATSAVLERTGVVVSWSVVNGWLKLATPFQDRRYLRLTRNAATGEEHWLVADFYQDSLLAATVALAVRVADGLQFAAGSGLYRRWLNTAADPTIAGSRLMLDIYSDGTGASVRRASNGTLQTVSANTWSLDSSSALNQVQAGSQNQLAGTRQWVLLRRSDSQAFVLEHSVVPSSLFDSWRLTVYEDVGASGR